MIQEPLKDIMFIYKGLQLYRGTKKRPLPEVKGPQVVCTAGGRENPAVRPPGLGKTEAALLICKKMGSSLSFAKFSLAV